MNFKVIPFFPLQQKGRKLDVIIASDGSDDYEGGYPNGTSIYDTYYKSTQPGYSAYPFPQIPAPADFIAEGLNKRPVFFGSSCQTVTDHTTPLIVYLPN